MTPRAGAARIAALLKERGVRAALVLDEGGSITVDIVPGVSGGTVALVLGIYERLIASVRAGSKALTLLVRRDVAGFRRWMAAVEWSFVIPLLLGIGVAFLTLAALSLTSAAYLRRERLVEVRS